MRSLLQANLDAVRERIARAAEVAGRSADEVDLLAVTKSVPAAVAAELFALGQVDLGENRPDALEAKLAHFAAHAGARPRWHWIGHLQRNKARRVLTRVEVVHSIDSERLLATASRVCVEEGLERAVYLQVKLSDEAAKHGLAPAGVPNALARAAELPGIAPVGLMTMAPLLPGASDSARRSAARRTFAALRELAETLDAGAFRGGCARLSMGMSADLEEAVREGSHVVRVGSALFAGLSPTLRAGGAR